MKILIASLLMVLLFTYCAEKKVQEASPVSEQSSSINEESTSKVLQHHWDAFKANDLEGTMADYTEESVLITPDKTFKGLTEIRENFVFAFSLFPKDSSTLLLKKSIVKDDVAYIIWEANAPKVKMPFGTDTFIIQNGKIVRQTFAAP